MRKITLIGLILLVSTYAIAQDVVISDSKTFYDNNYNPIVTLSIKNNTHKTITNITIRGKFSHPNDKYGRDILNMELIDKDIKYTINPNSMQTIEVPFKAIKKENVLYKYSGSRITIIRYNDGSIQNF